MAAKKPFVNYAGTVSELAAGDTVTGLGGTLIAYKANGTQDNIDLLDGGGITVLPIAQGGTGAATGPAALISLGAREVLAAARTYYVATTGSDSNNGLTAGAPFLTIQKAVDVVCSLDMSIYQVTIQVADGTYTAGSILRKTVGTLPPILQGNNTTPANCVISTTSADAVKVTDYSSWAIGGFKLTTATSGNGLNVEFNSTAYITGQMNFGACVATHIQAQIGSVIKCAVNYTISGAAAVHIYSLSTSFIQVLNVTVTITGTPSFSLAFARSINSSVLSLYTITWSGSATGKRYDANLNGVMQVYSQATTWLPGDVAGTTATGGQYA